MIHSVYEFLKGIGYDHPIHPMVTHVTIGLTIGTLIFGLVSVIFRRVRLKLTAWHCAVLAFISVVPTALFGYMDWREKFSGQWMPTIIIKMILAGTLFVCLFVGLMLGRGTEAEKQGAEKAPWREPRAIGALILYAVCAGIVVALGYFGGTLVY
jgi:uncharacterized membrane protein